VVAVTLAASLNLAAASPAAGQRQVKKPRLDHSGGTCVGMASFYHRKFSGRKMADGTRLDPESDSAASRSLPLGTVARVTNLKDGSSALVTIRDRGPYAKGRIIDLSPRTAKQLGIVKAGAARVEVTPLQVPQPEGSVASVYKPLNQL